MDTSVLEELGLTPAEIKIYVALLELGDSTAGPILEKTGLQNSVVHLTLRKLVQKGYVSYVKKGKVKHYHPTSPANILKFIEEKKQRFERLLPELIVRQKKVELQEAEVYEGFRGFKNMLYDFISDAQKGDEYLFFAFYTKNPDDYEMMYSFYREYDIERKKRGIVVKGLSHSILRKKFAGRTIPEIIYVDFPVPMNISVFRNKVIFTPWEDKQVSFMISSRQLADSFREYFYSIWNKYKK